MAIIWNPVLGMKLQASVGIDRDGRLLSRGDDEKWTYFKFKTEDKPMTLLEKIVEFHKQQEEALRKYLEELLAPTTPPPVPVTPIFPEPKTAPCPGEKVPFDFPKELFRIHEESKKAREEAAYKQLEKAVYEEHQDEFEEIEEDEVYHDEVGFDYILDILNEFVEDDKDGNYSSLLAYRGKIDENGVEIANPGLSGLNAFTSSVFGRKITANYDSDLFPIEFFEVTQP